MILNNLFHKTQIFIFILSLKSKIGMCIGKCEMQDSRIKSLALTFNIFGGCVNSSLCPFAFMAPSKFVIHHNSQNPRSLKVSKLHQNSHDNDITTMLCKCKIPMSPTLKPQAQQNLRRNALTQQNPMQKTNKQVINVEEVEHGMMKLCLYKRMNEIKVPPPIVDCHGNLDG